MLSPQKTHGPAPPAFDPGWLIQRTFDAAPTADGATAEDAVLAWLVRLPDGLDPAEAAAALLDAYAPTAPDDPLTRRILARIAEVRDFPCDRLARLPRTRRGRRDRRAAREAVSGF
jgi:hypothetical protein